MSSSSQSEFHDFASRGAAAQAAADSIIALENRIHSVLFNGIHRGTLLVRLDQVQRELLEQLRRHRGAADPITIAQLQKNLRHGPDDRLTSPRLVKDSIKQLIEVFGIPIGASRRPPAGYFLIVTPADAEAAARPLLAEIHSLSRRLRCILGSHRHPGLLAQLRQLDLDLREDASLRCSVCGCGVFNDGKCASCGEAQPEAA